MKMRLLDRLRRKHSKVTLTGEDIIRLRNDVDHLQSVMDKVVQDNLITLREDVNDVISATAKAIYKLEALEERMVTAEEKIKLLLK